MPDAVVVSIAKAVTSQLAAASLSQTITPVRSYADWAKQLEKDDDLAADELFVDVSGVASAQDVEADSRGSVAYEIEVDVAVRKKFSADKLNRDTGRVEVAEVDALVILVEEIHKLFAVKRMTDFAAATWDATRVLVAPHKAHLREWRQFTGIVRMTFVADQDL